MLLPVSMFAHVGVITVPVKVLLKIYFLGVDAETALSKTAPVDPKLTCAEDELC